ncbi:MAG TPA: hypothetical protein VGH28_06725 [Polyangiaceae bacterium]
MSGKASCGPHTIVVNTETVRIARCPCGTFHVTLVSSGVTVQLSPERLADLGRAIAVATPQQDATPRGVGTTPIN